MHPEEMEFAVEDTSTRVSGLLLRPREAFALYVLAHGAGAGMRHPFLESVANGLARRGVGTLRYQFPYMERGQRRPNPPTTLEKTVRSALRVAAQQAARLPLLAGGKSLGGRMTSRAAAGSPLPGVDGLIFLGSRFTRLEGLASNGQATSPESSTRCCSSKGPATLSHAATSSNRRLDA